MVLTTHCIVPMCPNFDGKITKILKMPAATTRQKMIVNEVIKNNGLFYACFPPGLKIPAFYGICTLHFEEQRDLTNHKQWGLIIAPHGLPRKMLRTYDLYLLRVKFNINKPSSVDNNDNDTPTVVNVPVNVNLSAEEVPESFWEDSTDYEHVKQQVISEFQSLRKRNIKDKDADADFAARLAASMFVKNLMPPHTQPQLSPQPLAPTIQPTNVSTVQSTVPPPLHQYPPARQNHHHPRATLPPPYSVAQAVNHSSLAPSFYSTAPVAHYSSQVPTPPHPTAPVTVSQQNGAGQYTNFVRQQLQQAVRRNSTNNVPAPYQRFHPYQGSSNEVQQQGVDSASSKPKPISTLRDILTRPPPPFQSTPVLQPQTQQVQVQDRSLQLEPTVQPLPKQIKYRRLLPKPVSSPVKVKLNQQQFAALKQSNPTLSIVQQPSTDLVERITPQANLPQLLIKGGYYNMSANSAGSSEPTTQSSSQPQTPLIAHEPPEEPTLSPIQSSPVTASQPTVVSPPIAAEATESVDVDSSIADIPEGANMQVTTSPSYNSPQDVEATISYPRVSAPSPIIEIDDEKLTQIPKMPQLETATLVPEQHRIKEMPVLIPEVIPAPSVMREDINERELEPGEVIGYDSDSEDEVYGHPILPQRTFKASNVVVISDDDDDDMQLVQDERIEIIEID